MRKSSRRWQAELDWPLSGPSSAMSPPQNVAASMQCDGSICDYRVLHILPDPTVLTELLFLVTLVSFYVNRVPVFFFLLTFPLLSLFSLHYIYSFNAYAWSVSGGPV